MTDEPQEQTQQQAQEQTQDVRPSLYVMNDEQARALAAQQHLLGWLVTEARRLEVEMAYVRGAAAQTQAELHAYLARSFGLDAAHEPLTIDLERHIITRPTQAESSASDSALGRHKRESE